jgi:hypothetical protein
VLCKLTPLYFSQDPECMKRSASGTYCSNINNTLTPPTHMWIPTQQLYVDARHVRSRWSLYHMGRKYVKYCRQLVVWQESHRFFPLYSAHSPSAHSMLSQHTSPVSTQYAESAHTPLPPSTFSAASRSSLSIHTPHPTERATN